ncbi:hypothetical protein [Streptomyces acidiscabies]|uniref:hypothetical protein n=1 Tax=Streptomyces acidiscabies TaxID=42234 RepID=UPI000950E2FA|nr:hypothetical protein [Streptomyces acidiscabies]
MTSSPAPDVVLGHHPDHGIVAANPAQHHIADWYLDRLGFHRVPNHPFLYALQALPAEAAQRAAQAGRLMEQAGLTVQSDFSIASRSTDPDVAIADHPHLGVTAATSTPWPTLTPSDYALRALGWEYQPSLDVYTLPAHLDALTTVVGTVRTLQETGHTVAVEPALAEAVAHRSLQAPPTAHRPGRPPMSAVAVANSPAHSATSRQSASSTPATPPPSVPLPSLPSRTR